MTSPAIRANKDEQRKSESSSNGDGDKIHYRPPPITDRLSTLDTIRRVFQLAELVTRQGC